MDNKLINIKVLYAQVDELFSTVSLELAKQ